MARTDYTTVLTTALDRIVGNIIDGIAQDGLRALRSVLDDAGFGQYEGLKNYEVFAHVIGNDQVVFEIQVDFESMDDTTKKTLASRDQDEYIRKASRMYAFSGVGGMQRRVAGGTRDARRPAHDALRPARDARRPMQKGARDVTKGSQERLAEHTFANRAPRGMHINNQGKLSIIFQKMIQNTTHGVQYPTGDFQGIMRKFMDKLNRVIAKQFVPQLNKVISRYSNG